MSVDDPADVRTRIEEIRARIPEGWDRSIDCGEGWWPLIASLDVALSLTDPGYVVHQVKQKMGGLRYYAYASSDLPDADKARFNAIIAEFERASYTICEVCGEPGEPVTGRAGSNLYRQSLCGMHAERADRDDQVNRNDREDQS